ncbi:MULTISPECIES: PP2C family protein-serine/threonine phosphatase [unclassified Fusibacter]|uniref:PP2C family protein-serine/threonine phosphatase n=1 Tax=unclassified Fusibacter TaxID=2624464 RepID=UPI001013B38F|nr:MULTISPECIES: fused response regulator/phosphatase [unclassified Fusibacter]MCK8060792.1 fused response regulator/phosphatase [Fusibacter sp. A2]NPE23088.1 fused response regulator/phosphatase [Fusibacter sp. A1]RXV59758.1 fused response regulator/phosphatase [Fusibacter sp. A1]
MAYCVLIADDATMNRVLVKKILSQSLDNLEFVEAINGQEVMDILEHTTVDLIILDLIMPVIDGYQVLKLIKKNPKISDIPVIVNSAITEIKSIENTLKEGAIDYFTKPLSPNDMKIILPLKAKNALLVYEQTRTIAELNRKINDELKNANTFANIMLPKSRMLSEVELFIKYHPSLGIGGDFFDCVEIDGKTHFMIADVTGHGIAAGMASSMVKILYRKSIEKPGIKPHEILEDINHSVFEIFDFSGHLNYFVFTAFVGCIENGVLSFANAGQPYPLIYHHAKQEFEEIRENGFLVGMMDDVTFETKEIKVAAGDLIFLYTDGLFCSGDKGDFTGWEKVLSLSRRLKHSLDTQPDDFLEEIFYAFHMIHKSHQSEFTDDVALMLMKIK